MTLPRQDQQPSHLQGMLLSRLEDFGNALDAAYNTLNGMGRAVVDGMLEPGMARDGTLTIALHDLDSAIDKINRYVRRASYAAEVESAKAKLKLAEDRYAEVTGQGTPGAS